MSPTSISSAIRQPPSLAEVTSLDVRELRAGYRAADRISPWATTATTHRTAATGASAARLHQGRALVIYWSYEAERGDYENTDAIDVKGFWSGLPTSSRVTLGTACSLDSLTLVAAGRLWNYEGNRRAEVARQARFSSPRLANSAYHIGAEYLTSSNFRTPSAAPPSSRRTTMKTSVVAHHDLPQRTKCRSTNRTSPSIVRGTHVDGERLVRRTSRLSQPRISLAVSGWPSMSRRRQVVLTGRSASSLPSPSFLVR